MAKPLTDEEREQIIALLDQGLSHGEVARRVGRAQRTVSREAGRIGKPVTQDNLARVARANETRRAVGEERRAELAAEAAEKMREAQAQVGQPQYQVAVLPGGKHGPPQVEVVEVPASSRDWRDQSMAARTQQQIMLDLVRYDERGDEDMSAVDDWLRHVQGG